MLGDPEYSREPARRLDGPIHVWRHLPGEVPQRLRLEAGTGYRVSYVRHDSLGLEVAGIVVPALHPAEVLETRSRHVLVHERAPVGRRAAEAHRLG
jgi:hypothetical protein